MTLLPHPTAPVTPAEAITFLCRQRPLEFRLVTGTLTELLNADPPQLSSATRLLLESAHSCAWGSTGVWLNPGALTVHLLPDWSLCEAVASYLDASGLDWISGSTRQRPDPERQFWSIYPHGHAPILIRAASLSAAAVLAYAECVRQQEVR